MTTRRNFITAAALVASAAPLKTALAQAIKEPAKVADFLFVQNANSMTFDKANGKLTLKGISPVTIFFTDRPERIAGNMPTREFVPFWSDGKDSFSKDAPNANLSILEKDRVVPDIVMTLRNPVLKGEDLAYDDPGGRHAREGRASVALHRYHRHADDAALVRRRCASDGVPARGLLAALGPSRLEKTVARENNDRRVSVRSCTDLWSEL
jgi:hypothetical protein